LEIESTVNTAIIATDAIKGVVVCLFNVKTISKFAM
jgi:hypothetical protein